MKPDYKKVAAYILGSLNREYLNECTGKNAEDNKTAFESLRDVYLSEYSHNVKHSKNYLDTFADYLQGLPSCVNMAFYNREILDLAIEWQSLPPRPTERQEDKFLANYWLFMANQYAKQVRKHNVNLTC